MLSAHNVSKLYRLYPKPADRLREALSLRRRRYHEEFWALRDVEFELSRGQTLGVVGPNGGGKSTLLQILAGILQPSTGRVIRKGRVAALLELGAGFNPEFSGRDNVYLNGEIMGFSRAEVERTLPAIERFAGIGEFIDRPVKTYSSGMHVRLAFSTAIHVEPDILIVDEALAVGDAVFANRCVRKFEELQAAGVTVVFVSHDLSLVKQVCDRAILLVDGRIEAAGSPSDVVNRYVGLVLDKQRSAGEDRPSPLRASHRHGDRLGEVLEIELLDAAGRSTRSFSSGELLTARVRLRFHHDQPEPMVGVLVRTRTGLDVFGTNTQLEEASLPACHAGEELEVEFSFDCLLAPQEYTLTVALQHAAGDSHDWLDDALAFHVIDANRRTGVLNLPAKIGWRRPVKVSAAVASGSRERV